MKILLSWLRDFVDVPGSADDIARAMSVRGFAVEGVEPAGDGDAVIDFEVTANRPDCMSVVGMAREIAAAFDRPLLMPSREASGSAPPGLAVLSPAAESDVDITIEAPDLCPRYAGALADVDVRPSPAWLQNRLSAAGVRPISNIVDITNYVLLELGQPMHAFDLKKLDGGRIVVRRAAEGERLATLDGQARALDTSMLVIADAVRPVAVAGVMGGANSEVTAATTTILFESACFAPLSVRRTSRTLGLKTDASMRFERGTDPHLPLVAMERACALLEATGAGRARGTVADRHPAPAMPAVLRLRRARIAGVLGTSIADAEVERILGALGFAATVSSEGWDVTVPTRRVDVVREIDLIEEVARHYGLDRIPVTFPALALAPARVDPRVVRARQIRAVLGGCGFFEGVTFGFISAPAAANFAPEASLVPIANPLSETFAVLRPSALPGLLDAVAHNRRREQRDVRLFEIGACFTRDAGERRRVACAWTGAAQAVHWSGGQRAVDFFDIKGVALRLCEAFGIDGSAEPGGETWLVPGRSATLVSNGNRLGSLGLLDRRICEFHGVPSGDDVYVLDVDLDAAEALVAAGDRRVDGLPRFPSVSRDISILVDDTLAASTLRASIRQAAPAVLVDLVEFDRYQGAGVPQGKVSLSFRLTFRAPDRTLVDAEVQRAMDDVLQALTTEHHAQQR